MRLFGWRSDPGTGYWRLHLPFGELAKGGHDVMVDDRMPDCVRLDAEADVVVASRTALTPASLTFQRLAAERRMLCVYETDDDVFSLDPSNRPAMAVLGQPDVQANIRANLAAAHLVTTTTDHLASVLREHTDAPVAVLSNRVPRWLTERPAPWDIYGPTGRLRYDPMSDGRRPLAIGYTGGASHVRDFGEIAKPLRAWLQKEGLRARFHCIGLDVMARVETIRGRARHTPWDTDVPAYLRSIGFDIGLAPLRDTEFARSKSPLKALEYGALGIPVVASNVEPYASYVRHGETGFLCGSPREWREALDALLDPKLRHRMGLAGRLQACEHLIEDHAGGWLAAYTANSALIST